MIHAYLLNLRHYLPCKASDSMTFCGLAWGSWESLERSVGSQRVTGNRWAPARSPTSRCTRLQPCWESPMHVWTPAIISNLLNNLLTYLFRWAFINSQAQLPKILLEIHFSMTQKYVPGKDVCRERVCWPPVAIHQVLTEGQWERGHHYCKVCKPFSCQAWSLFLRLVTIWFWASRWFPPVCRHSPAPAAADKSLKMDTHKT